jgi:hypothetical protein
VSRIVLVLVLGCSHRAALDSCADDLHGVWHDGSGSPWMILDSGRTLEAYPLFADSGATAPDVIAAPRVIDLTRAGGQLTGTVHRRYAHGGALCDTHAMIYATACRGDALDLVAADPPLPTSFSPCTSAQPAPAPDRWRR